MAITHQPVLVSEILRFLNVKPAGVYLDGTLGGGGHALALLELLGPDGLLIGMDRDANALERARERLKRFENRLHIHHGNFSEVAKVLEKEKIKGVDGILLDLGVSSLQLEEGKRGFSFSKEGPLDMRMDFGRGPTVFEKIKGSHERELAAVLKNYGEERYAERIAKRLIEKMKRGEINNTLDLANVAFEATPPKQRFGRIHPATRTFMALRIWVNEELEELKNFLGEAPSLLKADGRLCILSYHSLEDRIVKHTFRRLVKEKTVYELMTKKPVRPGEAEIKDNPRSRSAKLRVLRRKE